MHKLARLVPLLSYAPQMRQSATDTKESAKQRSQEMVDKAAEKTGEVGAQIQVPGMLGVGGG